MPKLGRCGEKVYYINKIKMEGDVCERVINKKKREGIKRKKKKKMKRIEQEERQKIRSKMAGNLTIYWTKISTRRNVGKNASF